MPDEGVVRQEMRRMEATDRVVDAWLQRSLATHYEPTLHEALPASMLALLDRLD